MDLFNAVREAAEENGIKGVMKLKDRCGLSYERTRRVWEGDKTAKIQDVSAVMYSLGYAIRYEKINA